MLTFVFGSIPKAEIKPAITELNAYCESTDRKRRAGGDEHKSKLDRFFWFRKGNALIISEEYSGPGNQLIRRDSGKFEFQDGYWLLYCRDATREWRRFTLAPPNKIFSIVFGYWIRDETGVFGR